MKQGVLSLDWVDDDEHVYDKIHEWVYETFPQDARTRYSRVELKDRRDRVKICMWEEDPYNTLLYIFYTVNTLRYEVEIVGWLTFDEVYVLFGDISPIEHINPGRTDFNVVSLPTVLPPSSRGEEKKSYFWFPIFNLPRDKDCPLFTGVYQEIPGFVCYRAQWYLTGGREHLPVPFGHPDWNPLEELDSVLGTLLIGDYMEHMYTLPDTILDMTKHHTTWTKMRTGLECLRLKQLFSHFTTEESIIWLMKRNFLNDAMSHESGFLSMTTSTNQDCMFFKQRARPGQAPPTVVWRCPMEKMTSGRVSKMPIYPPNGNVHLTYIDIFPFVCQMLINEARHFCSENIDRGYSKELKDIAKMVTKEYTRTKPAKIVENFTFDEDGWAHSNVPQKRLFSLSSHSHGVGGERTCNLEQVMTDDDKLLYAVSPPCVRNVMMEARFPRHPVRVFMVYLWRHAGFSMESIGRWLQAKHDRYPGEHTKERDSVKRFDHIFAYNQIDNKGPGCINVITGGRTGLVCPFALTKDATDIEDLANHCKSQCAPERRSPFYGPGHLMRSRIWQRSRNHVRPDDEEDGKRIKPDDGSDQISKLDSSSASSSSLDDEEEEEMEIESEEVESFADSVGE